MWISNYIQGTMDKFWQVPIVIAMKIILVSSLFTKNVSSVPKASDNFST